MYDLAVFFGGHAVVLLLGALMVLAARNAPQEPPRVAPEVAQGGAVGTSVTMDGDTSLPSGDSSPPASCVSQPTALVTMLLTSLDIDVGCKPGRISPAQPLGSGHSIVRCVCCGAASVHDAPR